MSNYIYLGNGMVVSEETLQHHGVKGMKWGRRRYQNKDGSLTPAGEKRYNSAGDSVKDAKAAYKSATKEYNIAYNKWNAKKLATYSPIKKHREASDKRWNEAMDKGKAATKAEQAYKDAKFKAKVDRDNATRAKDNEIRKARETQNAAVKGVKNEAKNYALGVLAGDNKAKSSARKNAAQLVNSYINSNEVANRATSGEKKAAAILAGVGAAATVAMVAKHAGVGKKYIYFTPV